nr:MAG TPA: hypothetical protein [Caudoviricetes sp.]
MGGFDSQPSLPDAPLGAGKVCYVRPRGVGW